MDMQDKYDPMTGELLSEQKAGDSSEWQFDPMTGQPILKNRKKKTKIIIIAAVIAVLAIVVFAGVVSGLFLSKRNKVLKAVVNTVNVDSHLADTLSKLSILRSNSYTVDYRMEIDEEDVDIDMEYAKSPQKKWLTGNISIDDEDLNFTAELTSSQIKVKLPDFDSHVFTYNFKDKKTGYITEVLDDDIIESIDNMLYALSSEKEQKAIGEKILDIIGKKYRSLKFETVDKKEFKINGKKRKCKGYRTAVTSDDVVDILRDIEDVYEDEYEYLMDTIDYSDLIDEFRDMPDLDITFYLNKNRLACVDLEADGAKISVLFDGDGKKEQSIKVTEDGDDVLELKKTEKNSKERYSLTADDREVMMMEYDYKSGDYSMELYAGYMNVEGSLTSSSGGLEFSVDEVNTPWESFDPGLSMSISKGSTAKDLTGKEFDIGEASEDELMDVMEELSELYYYLY